MRIGGSSNGYSGIRAVAATNATRRKSSADDTAEAPAPSRDLVPIAVDGQGEEARDERQWTRASSGAASPFLTQLIAGKLNLEVSRGRRRARPDIAVASYVATGARAHAFAPATFRRSL